MMRLMIRLFSRALPALLVLALAAPGALAKDPPADKKAASTKSSGSTASKTASKSTASTTKAKGGESSKDKKADAKGGAAKSTQVGSYGEWGAFTAQGKGKMCYALAKPKERAPATLKRDDAYIFISNRPAENVRNEVSIIMGFPMKDNSEPKAEVGGATFDLVAKGSNAWLKNPAEEGQFIEAMKKKGARLVVRASSNKGNSSVDTYALAGVGEALARIHKDCP
jgi:hypothetical protein